MKGRVTPPRSRRACHRANGAEPRLGKVLAADTGGRAFFNATTSQRHSAGGRRWRLTYVLAYYPSHGKWNGAFRSHHREGRPAGSRSEASSRLRRIAATDTEPHHSGAQRATTARAGAQPLEATGIGLTGHVSRGKDAASTVTSRSSIHVDPGAISIWRDGEAWSVSLALAIAQSCAERAGREERLRQRRRRRAGFTLRAGDVAGVHVLPRPSRSHRDRDRFSWSCATRRPARRDPCSCRSRRTSLACPTRPTCPHLPYDPTRPTCPFPAYFRRNLTSPASY